MDISDVDIDVGAEAALIGVSWDDATVWPPAVAELIREVSVEIAPGVYQVCTGTERDPADDVVPHL